MRLPQRSSKAFTLIELIVVIVILGILALIAIPTFSKVSKRGQDEAMLTTLKAVARNAQAIRAFDQANAWGTSYTDAIAETNYALGGTNAGGPYTAVKDTGTDPKSGEITYLTQGSEGVIISAKSTSGNVCMVGFSFTETAQARCMETISTPTMSTAATVFQYDTSILPDVPAPSTRGTYQSVVTADQPTVYLTFDGVSSTPTNLGSAPVAPMAYNVTPVNGSEVTGAGSVSFSGSSSYIDLGNNPALTKTAPYTVELWTKSAPKANSTAYLYRFRLYGVVLTLGNDGTLNFVHLNPSHGPVSTSSRASVADNQWHHVVGAWDGKRMNLYIDGVLNVSVPATTPPAFQPGSASLGRDGNNPGGYFKGQLSEFAYYDKALTASQVKAHYNAR